MRTKLFQHTLFVPIIILIGISCSTTTPNEKISAEGENDKIIITVDQFKKSGMIVGAMEQRPFARQVKANGYVDVPPERMASISVKLGGFVRRFSILPGDRVAKGSVLFTLENPEFIQLQQDYLEARAQLHYLESDYERQKGLASENISSQKNYLKAESDFRVTQARYLGLQEKLKLLHINTRQLDEGKIESTIHVYAPITGYISKVNITQGMFVHPADIAVEIVDTEHLHIELKVFEKDIMEINKGQSLTFTVPGSGSHVYSGEIYLVGKTLESDTRTVNIHGHIHDEKDIRNLLPGMYVEASIAVSSENRIVLPSDAIVSAENGYYALVQTSVDGTEYIFSRREIKIGEFNNQWTEILNVSDFKSSDIFLVRGAFNLIQEHTEELSH